MHMHFGHGCGGHQHHQKGVSILFDLSPGTPVSIQIDSLPFDSVIFQGFQHGQALFTGVTGTPAGSVTRIPVKRINAVAV